VVAATFVCGQSEQEAVIWDLSGARRTLDRSGAITTSGGRKSFDSAQANGINSGTAVAGYASAGPHPAAVVWPNPTAPMIVLDKFLKNTAITELNFARAINEFGYIVGSGWDSHRAIRVGFLAIPK
jgi:hypothetical protein